jgi:hypothetical protein
MFHLPGLGKCEPESEGKLEDVVEWEPVHSIDQALKDTIDGLTGFLRGFWGCERTYVKKPKTTQYCNLSVYAVAIEDGAYHTVSH